MIVMTMLLTEVDTRLCQRDADINRRVDYLLVLVRWSLAAPAMVNQELASKRLSSSLYKSEYSFYEVLSKIFF